jgi:ABC-type transport system substrate-binding protein
MGAYSRILAEKESFGPPKSPTIVGDLAESWELSNGGLTLTAKLRRDAKFDPRPPTNGRGVDADDVVYSLNKTFDQSPYASQISNRRDPTSPIESVTKIDQYTVQYKMAFPWAPLMITMANGIHLIMPRESESGFNPRTDTRGSGAWMLEKYEPSVRMEWRKNPNWFRKDVPFMDGYDLPIITEPAARVGQFTAKHLDAYAPQAGGNSPAGDLLALINQLPDVKIYEGDVPTAFLNMAFGSKPGSPFYDIRVRRAFSMLVDRELFGNFVNGIDQYAKANIDVPINVDGHVSSFWKPAGFWIDPKDASKWGDAGKYWQHNVAEAKAMLSAAGYANGLDVVLNQANRTHGTPEQAQIIAQMLSEGGVRPTINVVDYNTIFLPIMWVPGEVKGNFDGVVFGLGTTQAHIASSLYVTTHSKGSFTTGRRWDEGQDKIDALIDANLKELDETKLRGRVEETSKALASYMSGFPVSSGAPAPRLAWPWVQNYRTFWTSIQAFDAGGAVPSSPSFLFNWIDPSLKTS